MPGENIHKSAQDQTFVGKFTSNDGEKRTDKAIQTNVQNEAIKNDTRSWLQANSARQQRISSSQSSQIKHKHFYQKTTFLSLLIVLSIFSMAVNCAVWYVALGKHDDCKCSVGHDFDKVVPVQVNLTVVIDNMKIKLKRDLQRLRNKMDSFSGNLTDEHKSDANNKDWRKTSDVFEQTVVTLESLYNNTEKNIARAFQQTTAKVERLEEMNEKPNCLFKQAKKSKNGTLVTVDVPRRTEDRVTVAVTCSTSLQHTADVAYMVPSDTLEEYTCHCKNKIHKQTDCVAYYWECMR